MLKDRAIALFNLSWTKVQEWNGNSGELVGIGGKMIPVTIRLIRKQGFDSD